MPKKNKILIIAGVIMASFAIAVLSFRILLWCFIDWMNPFNDALFTTEEWANTRYDARAPMALDLVSHHLPSGLSQSDVKRLLGAPDRTLNGGKDSGGNRFIGSKTYAYHIGSWTHYKGFDDAFVYVHLNEDGIVIGSEINGY